MGDQQKSTGEAWERQAQISRDVLENSIPKQWLLSSALLPAKDRHNVVRVPEECGLLSPLELEMTNQNVAGLLDRYQSGRWTVEDVTTAFLKKATIGHQLLNFATEFLTETALHTAKELDAHFKRTRTLIGPLHGIPISVKEHVAIEGRICNASFVSKISNVSLEDAHIVKLLKRAGAVIHVRTNQPQSIMHLDCTNNITGTTLNPYHRRLSPGGSSGGEGAAVGFRCSVLGVGTDIGGSVRVPAAFCNAYGFKPTALRNPSFGLFGIMGGQESIRGCVGPLSQSLDDIIAFEKAVLDQEPWDTETILVPLPWRKALVTQEKLTVGILLDDGIVRPHPPVLRALKTAEAMMTAAGIKTVPWAPYKHEWGWDIVRKLYVPEGGKRARDAIDASGEPILPLTEYILNANGGKELSVLKNWQLNLERETYRREYHAQMKAAGVDVILCPAYVGAGVLQGEPRYWHYSSVWNVLDQPAVTFPSGISAQADLDLVDQAYTPRSEEDNREYKAYDPILFDGVPISLQLVGKHHRDEELLAAAKLIEAALRSEANAATLLRAAL
ncbi:fatty-acid amide hydrolase [Thozetella sp. PMI_491]|nr:fatty-acid amide hydrolase [Thozetella sp. PMI_491]